MTASRPIGIAILCVANIFVALLFVAGSKWLVPGVTFYGFGAMYGASAGPVPYYALHAALIIAVIRAIVLLVITYGLWEAMNWARWFYGIALAFSIFADIGSLSAYITILDKFGLVVLIGVQSAVICYLIMPSVKSYFGVETLPGKVA